MSYGPNLPDLLRRAADYVDKILRGAKPGDIPVEQPTRFDLVINLTTAKALGLTLPPTLLALAEESSNRVRFCCAAYVAYWHFASFAAVQKFRRDWGHCGH